MTDQNLQDIYLNLLREYFPRRRYELQAVFYNSKAVRHTITLEHNTIKIRIAEALRPAPIEILRILGLIMLAKIFRFKVDSRIRRYYNQYVRQEILPQLPAKTRAPSARYTPAGRYYNLDEFFESLNHKYFSGKLSKPVIGWSLKKAYTRLGFYAAEKNLLVISKIFDSSKVPEEVVEYMMYHEMLHIYFPAITKNGRRTIHSREFKKMEQAFPEYERIQKWIQYKRHKL